MNTIHKYSLPVQHAFSIAMPEGAQILSVQTQDNLPVLWAVVNTEAQTVRRKFRLAMTGEQLGNTEAAYPYIGTFQLNEGRLVCHLFERV